MSSKDLIPKDIVSCAVSCCTQNSGNAIKDGYSVSFHRFPKDLQLQQTWAEKCKRSDEWNPQSSYICSMHFTPRDLVHDLRAELYGYIPSFRELKQNSIPTLNLTESEILRSSINSSGGIYGDTAKQLCDILTKSFSSGLSSDF